MLSVVELNTENCSFSDAIGCGKEFDDELEEGEIVDDDSDVEPEKFEKNHSGGYSEHSRETVIYHYYKQGIQSNKKSYTIVLYSE